jgi:hypothetical protein
MTIQKLLGNTGGKNTAFKEKSWVLYQDNLEPIIYSWWFCKYL